MTHDELATRAEGALTVVETSLAHCEHLERTLKTMDWLQQLRAEPSLLRDEVGREAELEKAVTRVHKLDPDALKPLGAVRRRLARLASRRLRDLGVEPTATKLEDLLAQLVSRAVDLTWEQDRIARSWKGLDRRRRRHALIASAAGVPAMGAFLAIASVASPWLALAPIAVYVIGLGVSGLRGWPCPQCGRALSSLDQPCPHCHHTRPTD